MALYKQAEFAKKCGISNAHLSVNKSRGKVIVKDGFIDDSIQENAEFLQKCLEKLSKEPEVIPHPVAAQNKKSTKIKSEKEVKDPDPAGGKSQTELNKEKRALEIEKLKVDTRLQELKEEKIRGEVIPVRLVNMLFSAFSQAFITSQKDGNEFLLINIAKEARLTGDQLARLRGKMVDILNDGADKAIAATQRNIKSVMDEFSIKKEVGEHD